MLFASSWCNLSFFIFGRKLLRAPVCGLEHGTEQNSNEFELRSSGLAGTSPKQVDAKKVSDSNAHILVPPQCSLLPSLSQVSGLRTSFH
jgi:hypothetical protein